MQRQAERKKFKAVLTGCPKILFSRIRSAGGTNDILTKHNDYGDTWFELGLGGNVRISRTGNFYGEVTRGFGGDINKKWSVNAGLRFTF